ncbi:tyrosine-type recombinase/integrase [Paenibacillus rhizolycopersici]|uniref:tyrosine-type recombinase/integrase n=1 Tax=Paenibacillus rhizolycopersici TaxID=2780073 RepID=UPI003D2A5B31
MANIQKRGDNSWFLTVNAGKNAKGKYIRFTKTIHCRTKREAESEYAKFRLEVEAGEYIAPEKMTFGAFVEEWHSKYAVKHLAFKTLYTYRSNLKNRILPAFQHMSIKDIKPLHIVDFLDKLEKENSRGDKKSGGLSSGTIEIDHRILKNIFKRAVEWRIINRNPVSDVKKPKVTSKEIIPYDEVEVNQMLKALQREPFHWRMLITLALTTGLRRSEILGLEWKHVDLSTGVIEVRQTMVHALKGEVIVKQPKTKKSVRKVALPSSVLEELREYHTYRIQERHDIGNAWRGGSWLFLFSHPDGQPFHHEAPYQWFRNFILKNKLRYIRFHDLRHTSATILINQGVHAKIISERLGHGSITTTMNIYGHALRTADQAAADKFESLFNINKAQGQ